MTPCYLCCFLDVVIQIIESGLKSGLIGGQQLNPVDRRTRGSYVVQPGRTVGVRSRVTQLLELLYLSHQIW